MCLTSVDLLLDARVPAEHRVSGGRRALANRTLVAGLEIGFVTPNLGFGNVVWYAAFSAEREGFGLSATL